MDRFRGPDNLNDTYPNGAFFCRERGFRVEIKKNRPPDIYLADVQQPQNKKEPEVKNKVVNADTYFPLGGASAVVSTCVLVVTVCTLLLFVVFRKRLEYRVYRIKRNLREHRRQWRRDTAGETFVLEEKKFDVYLSYAEEIYPWVKDRLLPLLDEEEGEENNTATQNRYKVYCADRDAHPCKTELENMCENIEQSRMAIVVLSRHYTQKPLHTVELGHILFCMDTSIIQGVVLIMTEELSYKHIPPALHHQVQQDKILRWEMYKKKEREFRRDVLRSLR